MSLIDPIENAENVHDKLIKNECPGFKSEVRQIPGKEF